MALRTAGNGAVNPQNRALSAGPIRRTGPGPKIERALLPSGLERLDQPSPGSVFAEQLHPAVAGEGEKMGVWRLVVLPNLFPSPLGLAGR
jgi:hypothetical protein